MRSRFTAHAIGDFEHLHRTYLPTAEKAFAGERWGEPEAKWTRLVIHAHELGPKPEMAMVDFSAYFQADDGTEHAHHEKAEFKQIQRTWYYTRPLREGPPPVRSTAPKVGRNDPCPCGSGKKYKHCCGR
jgi:SEC-C motif domain protein